MTLIRKHVPFKVFLRRQLKISILTVASSIVEKDSELTLIPVARTLMTKLLTEQVTLLDKINRGEC